MSVLSLTSTYWRLRFGRWRRARRLRPGYTLLVPVPGDLPVFTDLALAVCRLQAHGRRLSTLVIPDAPSPAVEAAVAREAPSWPGGGLELLRLPWVDAVVLPRLKDPGRNHGAQILAGVTASSGECVLLHDADLFPLSSTLHDDQHAHLEAAGLDVVGVSRAWDPWYAERGRELAATWEQCARVEWFRRYAPFRHIGHDATVGGERHTFDTTFWPQLHTDPARVDVAETDASVAHFNYVISTYRRYQTHDGQFHDQSFRLLLIRLFVDLFDRSGAAYDLPALEQLTRGLDRDDAPVVYGPDDRAAYLDFRRTLDAVLTGPWTDRARLETCTRLLARFDAHYGHPQAAASLV